MSSNSPYQAPESEILDPAEGGEALAEPPNSCNAGQGWSWIAEGFELFKASPGNWIGMIIVYIVIMFVLGFIPFLGSLATVILGPVFTGGFMIACRNMEQGQPNFSDLFAGFQDKFGPLALVGLIYFIGVFVLSMVVFGVLFGSMLASGDPAAMEEGLANFDTSMILGILIMFALLLPFIMGIWFAPALIVFHDLSPWVAFKRSFSGCLKNIVPFLVYGLIALVFFIVALIPLGLGMLVFMPVVVGSMYAGYRMIFLR